MTYCVTVNKKGDTLTVAAVTKGAKDLFKQFLLLLAPYDGKFKNMDAMVVLFKDKADASTLVHEIAHYAFET